MSFIQELFSGQWAQALGWTLLHSLWQVMLIGSVVILTSKFFNVAASARYLLACCGMAFAVLTSCFTYFFIYEESQLANSYVSSIAANAVGSQPALQNEPADLSLRSIYWLVDSNMSFVLITWIAGIILFSVRLLGSWWYVNNLRHNAVNVPHEWSNTLESLKTKLNIRKIILLAESVGVNAPVVIGYFKPIVLVPVGMFSGLTSQEIETIFLHELAHIKRHDYLVNLIQSVVEVVFFFNPFIWILSGWIRREREYCCDDLVIKYEGDAVAYAYALTRLEETRLTGTTLALSLGNNKNQLLNRIKRMMEKSFKPQNGHERVVLPVLLVTVGLICASWLSMKTDERNLAYSVSSSEEDTIVTKARSAEYTRETITTVDENGNVHKVSVVRFGDDTIPAPKPLKHPQFNIDVIPAIPAMEPLDFPSFSFSFKLFDTIPPMPEFNQEEWEHFHEQFEEQFDFNELQMKELNHIMENIETEMSSEEVKEILEETEKIMEDVRRTGLDANEIQQIQEAAMMSREEALQQVAAFQRENTRQFEQRWANGAAAWQQTFIAQFQEPILNVKTNAERTEAFRSELKGMLIHDGYLSPDDELREIHWNIRGEIRINGKTINASDNKKYQDLHVKYFGEGC